MAITTTEADKIIPEYWISEVIARLRKNTVLSQLVRRDFSQETANKGDTINIPKRGTVTVRTKAEGAGITSDSPTNDSVAVVLDQHRYVSWAVEDNAAAKALQVGLQYLDDAVPAIAEAIETLILAEYANAGAQVGTEGVDIDGEVILSARKELNDDGAPMTGRLLIISSKDEKNLLSLDKFTDADKRGDGGSALTEARLGRIYGFDTYMSQLVATSGSAPVNTHNIALHPNAIVLATRPLPNPNQAGVRSQVVTDPVTGLTLRYTEGYSITTMSTIHTVDILFGIKTVDERLLIEVLS